MKNFNRTFLASLFASLTAASVLFSPKTALANLSNLDNSNNKVLISQWHGGNYNHWNGRGNSWHGNHNNNYYGNNWHGGGWYGGGYHAPIGWGLAGLAAGLVLGTVLSAPPPSYAPVYMYSNYGDQTPYIYADGIFHRRSGAQFVVISPPVGAVVSYLPPGCNTVFFNGYNQYNCSGIIYRGFYREGTLNYRVISY